MADNQSVSEVLVRVRGEEGLRVLQREVQKTRTQMNQLNSSTSGLAQFASRNSFAFTNIANQLSDIAVQASMGTNMFRVLGQQVPQMAAGFSGLGAAILVVGSSLVGFIPLLQQVITGGVDFKKTMDDAAKAVDELRSATRAAQQPMGQFRKEWGQFADAARDFAELGASRELFELGRAVDSLAEAFGDVDTTADVKATIDLYHQLLANTQNYNDMRRQGLAVDGLVETNKQKLLETEQSLARATGLTVAQAQEYLTITTGIERMIANGEVSTEFAKRAELLREQLYEQGRLTDEMEAALLKAVDITGTWIDIRDATEDAKNEAREAANAYTDASLAVRQLAAAAQQAAAWSSSLRSAAAGLATDTVRMTAEINAMAEGMDRYAVSTAGRIAAEQKRLRDMQGTVDPIQFDVMTAEFEQWKTVLLEAEEAQRAHAAATDAMNESLRETTGTSGGGGGTVRSATDELDRFITSLERYRTDAEQAVASSKLLKDNFAVFGGQLNAEQLELYNRAIAELAETANGTAAELGEFGTIIQDNFTGALGGIIDQTTSVNDAFSDMLDSMLKDMAKFLVNRNMQYFFQLLAGGGGLLGSIFGGTGGFGAITSPFAAPSPAPPGLPSPAPPIPAPGFVPGQLSRIGRANPGNTMPAAAMGRSNVNVTVYNEASNADVQVEEVTNANGETDIRMYIKNLVKSELGSGSLDRTLQANYGIRRRPIG